ncbi:MAG TPA: hypothetical protein GXX29_07335 [Firmicutes bacterium]|nr:hypothetical protein [Bacillota bacterium]
MDAFLAGLNTTEKIFAASAIIGGIIFIVRMLMTLLGGFDHHDGPDVDLDSSGDADASFKALSIQGITAFFMMFGLVGLALSLQSGVGAAISVLGGVIAGFATVWVIGRIFVSMQKWQSEGTLRWENAIGQEGTVYLTIPANGTGQVSVAVQGQLRVGNAVSANHEVLKTGERVVVIDVVNGNVLVVSPQRS